MFTYNKEGYKKLILNTTTLEHWEIVIESDIDKKLYDILIGEPIKQKKQRTKKSMSSIVHIIFGTNSMNSLLNDGFV